MENIYYFIDESGTDLKSKFIVIGLAILANPGVIRSRIMDLKHNILHDPDLCTIPSVIKRKNHFSFHYASDCLEVKRIFIDFLSSLTFNAYITYANKYNMDRSYEMKSLYSLMLQNILKDRIIDHKNKLIHICIEKPFRQINALSGLINLSVSEINRLHRLKIQQPQIEYRGKEEPCLCIPDYVCGIFHAHLLKLNEINNYEKREFKRIIGKIRVIHDYAIDEFYTRKKPFPIELNP